MTDFSIENHAIFLSGYLDAVARSITTDSVICNLSASFAEAANKPDHRREDVSAVVSWSYEFCALTDDFLGIDARSRLGFYLVEYICWFQYFTIDVKCYKCASDLPESKIIYYLEWPDGASVLISASMHHQPAPHGSFIPMLPHQAA